MKKKFSLKKINISLLALLMAYSSFSLIEDNETLAIPIIEEKLVGGFGFTMYLNSNGVVSTWGKNDLGQLGQGNNDDTNQPVPIPQSFFNNEKIIKLEAGFFSGMAVTENNVVYMWGRSHGNKPRKINNTFTNVMDIAISDVQSPNNHPGFQIIDNKRMMTAGSGYSYGFINGLYGPGALNSCANYVDHLNFRDYSTYSVQVEDCPDDISGRKRQIPGTEVPIHDAIKIHSSSSYQYVSFSNEANEMWVGGTTRAMTSGVNGSSASTLPKKLLKNAEIIKEVYAGYYPMYLNENDELFMYTDLNKLPLRVRLEDAGEIIKEVSVGDQNTWILSTSGKIYGFGPNDKGQLGSIIPSTGHFIARNTTVEPIALNTGIQNVKKIGYGVGHLPYIGMDDKIYLIGSNSTGQLGKEDTNTKKVFSKINWSEKITAADYNNQTLFFSDEIGRIFTAGGSSISNRMGVGGETNVPALIATYPSNVKEFNGEMSNKLTTNVGTFLLENGQLYGFGTRTYMAMGQTIGGNGPVQITDNQGLGMNFNILSGSISERSGIALSEDNKVYSWGYDSSGSLGLSSIARNYNVATESYETWYLPSFQKVNFLDEIDVKKVYAGPRYIRMILTTDGKVYWYGANTYSKHAGGNNFNTRTSCAFATVDGCGPIEILGLSGIQDIVFGDLHTLFLRDDGKVLSVGENEYGQLGDGTTVDQFLFTEVKDLPIIKAIGAGDNSSYAIAENGDVYSWGDNRYGQLGLDDLVSRSTPRKVTGITGVKYINGGSKNAVLITETGEMWVTGSDEYGQLALAQSPVNTEPSELVFPPVMNVVFPTETIYELDRGENISITGDVSLSVEGKEMEITYELENATSKTEYTIKNYISSSTPENFTLTLPIVSSELDYGNYLLTVEAREVATGVNTKQYFSFSMLDKTSPTIDADLKTTPRWTTESKLVNLTLEDSGGSGLKAYRYALSPTMASPTEGWSGDTPAANNQILLNESGIYYLHIIAFDNENNSKNAVYGPYYIDIHTPVFQYNLPLGVQEEKIILPITTKEASNLLINKWENGDQTSLYFETGGRNLTNPITITENGRYTLYAKDENNQSTLQTLIINNIHYKPFVSGVPRKKVIPHTSKMSYGIPFVISHRETDESVRMILNNGQGETKTSVENYSGLKTSSPELATYNFGSFNENVIYNGWVFAEDQRGLKTPNQLIDIEIYNPNVNIKTEQQGIRLNWTESKLAEEYKIMKNGIEVYKGTGEEYFDQNVSENGNYTYELYTKDEVGWEKVFESIKNYGTQTLITPNLIKFPSTIIQDNNVIYANFVDRENVEYENTFEFQQDFRLELSGTNFSSTLLNEFDIESLVLEGTEIRNSSGTMVKIMTDTIIRNTPTIILTNNDLSEKNYFKWMLPKEKMRLTIPENVKIENGESERYISQLTINYIVAPN